MQPETPPEANALYFGVLPPGPAYEKPKEVEQPVILDWDIAHPLMQYIRDLSLIVIAEGARSSSLPAGVTILIESNQGPLAFVAPREGFTDAVVTFPLIDGDHVQHDLVPVHQLPALHLQQHPGAGQRPRAAGDEVHLPGQPVVLHAETIGERDRRSTRPDGQGARRSTRSPQGTFIYNHADDDRHLPRPLGAETACCRSPSTCSTSARATSPRAGSSPRARPTSQAESYKIKIGYNPVAGTQKHPARPARTSGGTSPSAALGVAAGRVVHLQPAGLYLTHLGPADRVAGRRSRPAWQRGSVLSPGAVPRGSLRSPIAGTRPRPGRAAIEAGDLGRAAVAHRVLAARRPR